MADPDDRLARLEELLHEQQVWAAAHDARINEKWENQNELNATVAHRLNGFHSRLLSAEKRIIWLAAGAAAAGGALGNWIPF